MEFNGSEVRNSLCGCRGWGGGSRVWSTSWTCSLQAEGFIRGGGTQTRAVLRRGRFIVLKREERDEDAACSLTCLADTEIFLELRFAGVSMSLRDALLHLFDLELVT